MAEKKQVEDKMNFFKKAYYSIFKIEKYPDLAAQGVPKAIGYMAKVVLIMSIILCLGMVYQTNNMIQDVIEYVKNELPEFSYKDGVLKVESEEPIYIEENEVVGRVIIDTSEKTDEEVNQYINSIGNEGNGIIVLSNKIILKNVSVAGTVTYEYKETITQMGITEFNKQQVIDYARSEEIFTLYISLFLTLLIYSFVMYFIVNLRNSVLVSFFGLLSTLIARIKMRYAAIFNMSVYALTLSSLLNILYITINIFVSFNMTYFSVMYYVVACIYVLAAIFIIKSDFIKKQAELIKIAEVQKQVKEELEEKSREEEKREKKDKKQKEKKEKEEGQDENLGTEPEGNNA